MDSETYRQLALQIDRRARAQHAALPVLGILQPVRSGGAEEDRWSISVLEFKITELISAMVVFEVDRLDRSHDVGVMGLAPYSVSSTPGAARV